MDEHAARVHALELERLRPDAKPPSAEELFQRLIGTLHQLYKTPPDRNTTS